MNMKPRFQSFEVTNYSYLNESVFLKKKRQKWLLWDSSNHLQKELLMEYAVEMNCLIKFEMEGSIDSFKPR